MLLGGLIVAGVLLLLVGGGQGAALVRTFGGGAARGVAAPAAVVRARIAAAKARAEAAEARTEAAGARAAVAAQAKGVAQAAGSGAWVPPPPPPPAPTYAKPPAPRWPPGLTAEEAEARLARARVLAPVVARHVARMGGLYLRPLVASLQELGGLGTPKGGAPDGRWGGRTRGFALWCGVLQDEAPPPLCPPYATEPYQHPEV